MSVETYRLIAEIEAREYDSLDITSVLTPSSPVKVRYIRGERVIDHATTTLRRFSGWLGDTLTQGTQRETTWHWVDMTTTPSGILIGHSGDMTAALVLRTWHDHPFVSLRDSPWRDAALVLPPTLFGAVWREIGRPPVWTGVACIPTIQPLDGDSLVYPWPFGNVYDTGNICWGSVNITSFVAPRDIHNLAACFFDSEFNRDLQRVGETRWEVVEAGRVRVTLHPDARSLTLNRWVNVRR